MLMRRSNSLVREIMNIKNRWLRYWGRTYHEPLTFGEEYMVMSAVFAENLDNIPIDPKDVEFMRQHFGITYS